MLFQYHAIGARLRRCRLELYSNAMRVDSLHDCAHFVPDCNGSIDGRFSLGTQSAFGRRHRGRQDREQPVAIVRFAERILQRRKTLRSRFKRRIQRFKAFEGIAKAFACDSKVVKALLVTRPQTGR